MGASKAQHFDELSMILMLRDSENFRSLLFRLSTEYANDSPRLGLKMFAPEAWLCVGSAHPIENQSN